MWTACAAAAAWALGSLSPELWLIGACLGTLAAAVIVRYDIGRHGHRQHAELAARVALLEESVGRLSEALESLRAGASVPATASSAPSPAAAAPQTTAAAPQDAAQPDIPQAAAPGAATPRPRPERARPSGDSRQGTFARLFYGTALAKVGAALLLISLGSLLKLTAEYLQASMEARLGVVALLALGLAAFGWKQRGPRPRTGLALQAAGLAALFFLAWFMGPASRPWGGAALVSAGTSFALLAGAAAAGAALAYVQRSGTLAIGAVAAAFLAPFAAFAGGGEPRFLLYYSLVVGLVVAACSLARNARSLNLVSFAATLAVCAAALSASRSPQALALELVLLAVLYSAIPAVFAGIRGARLGHPADFILVFGVPALALVGGAAAVPQGHAAALAVLAAGAYYLGLRRLLLARPREDAAVLAEAHALIGLALVTLAAPLAFGITATAMILAAEGVLVAWYGLSRRHDVFSVTGLAIHLGAGLYFLLQAGALERRVPVLNEIFAGCFVLAIAAFAASHVLRRHAPERTAWSHLATPLGILGAFWWFGGSVSEIARWVPRGEEWAAILAFVGVIAVAMELFGNWRRWHRTRMAAATLPAVLALFALISAGVHGHVMAGWMAWVFPPAVLLAGWMLGRHERSSLAVPLTASHAGLAWLVCIAAGLEAAWLVRGPHAQVWQLFAWGATIALFAVAISVLCVARVWPARGRVAELMRYCGLPAVALGVLWVIYANAASTGAWGYAYVPVFNPLDLSSTFVLATGTWMLAAARRIDPRLPPGLYQGLAWALAAGKFWWANATVARTVHHYTGMPYTLPGMLESVALQAILSVVWTISALAVMVWGTRGASRTTWFVGFGMLAVVGLKMVLFDLRHLGSASWTFSLLGIAVLVMAAGYFTPTPPRRADSMA